MVTDSTTVTMHHLSLSNDAIDDPYDLHMSPNTRMAISPQPGVRSTSRLVVSSRLYTIGLRERGQISALIAEVLKAFSFGELHCGQSLLSGKLVKLVPPDARF